MNNGNQKTVVLVAVDRPWLMRLLQQNDLHIAASETFMKMFSEDRALLELVFRRRDGGSRRSVTVKLR